MWNRLLSLALGVTGCLLSAGCVNSPGDYRTQRPDPELLHAAMEQLTSVIVYDIFSPPQASRVYAYASVAAYEALRHDYPEYGTLAGQLDGLPPVPAPAADSEHYLPLASIHALMTVGKALTFSQARMDSLRTAMDAEFRRKGIPAPVLARSIAYGEKVAEHVLSWAKTDGFIQRLGYPKFTVTSEPGRWVPTPPGYMDAVEPSWALVRPFVLDSASQFRPDPPPAFDTAQGSPFFRETTEVYEIGKRLTAEQREIATFWNDNPYTMNIQGHTMFATKQISPGGHWMAIVAIAARRSGADLMRSAGAYARTAVAVADGFISCWDEKYRSNLVRPETVINAHLDEAWEPLLQTPPFPEYPSGHSVISAAAAAVLADEFGADFAFDDSTREDYGSPVRSFTSFEAAAAEAAVSRLYGGIHYRAAIEQGFAQGRRVGELVVQRVRPWAKGAPLAPLAADGTERPLASRSDH